MKQFCGIIGRTVTWWQGGKEFSGKVLAVAFDSSSFFALIEMPNIYMLTICLENAQLQKLEDQNE